MNQLTGGPLDDELVAVPGLHKLYDPSWNE